MPLMLSGHMQVAGARASPPWPLLQLQPRRHAATCQLKPHLNHNLSLTSTAIYLAWTKEHIWRAYFSQA